MDIVLNELSVPFCDKIKCSIQAMQDLMEVYSSCQKVGIKDLKIHCDLMAATIAPDYTIAMWISDENASKEHRMAFLQYAAKVPYVDEILSLKTAEKIALLEFYYNGNCVKGMGVAYLLGTPLISFYHATWNVCDIPVEVRILDDDDGEVVSEVHIIRHCSRKEHVVSIGEWLSELDLPVVSDGIELWVKKGILYPNLIFCENTRKQLSYLHANTPSFQQILCRFQELQRVAAVMNNNFNPGIFKYKVTPESETRINGLGDKLKFQGKGAAFTVFSWHLRYTPGKGRIHFSPDEATNQIYVGHIGPKIE